MTISAIHNSPTLTQTTSLNRMAGTFNNFLYSIPALLVSFLALQSTAFAGSAGNPFQARECPLIGDVNPQDTTAVWTNEIGQASLNPKDIEGSYRTFAESFSSYLEENVIPYIGKGDEVTTTRAMSQTPRHSLSNQHTPDYSPQILELEGALRANDEYLLLPSYNGENSLQRFNSGYSIDNSPELLKLSQKAKRIIKSWHPPGSQIKISDMHIYKQSLKPEIKEGLADPYHLDQGYNARLIIPAKETLLEKGIPWLTKKGETVYLLSEEDQDNPNGRLKVSTTDGKIKILERSQIDTPLCYSGKMSRIIPGLVRSSPAMNSRQPEITLKCQNDRCKEGLKRHTISIPYDSILYPGGNLVHAAPDADLEPNRDDLKAKGCGNDLTSEKIHRTMLSFYYTVNPPNKPIENFIKSIIQIYTVIIPCIIAKFFYQKIFRV